MIKILMLVPLWKRPEIVRIFIDRMEAVICDYATVQPLFILSPEDPDLKLLEKMTADYQCLYYSNEYLGDKMNAGMVYSMGFDWEYLMNMGSDNVYTQHLWNLYYDCFLTGEPYFSINDCYVYDIVNNQAMHLNKYVDEPALGGIGAGRMIHRTLLEDDPAIYRPQTCQGMDGFSAMTLYRRGYTQKIIDTEGQPVMLDIKTNTNVNHALHIWPHRDRDVDVTWIRDEFGLNEVDTTGGHAFELLTFDGFHSSVIKLSQEISKEDAFNSVNVRYQMAFGKQKYKNVDSYKNIVSRRYKK